MKIFHGKSGNRTDVLAGSPIDAPLDTALEIFRNLEPGRGFMGIGLDDKFTLQMAVKKDGKIQVELLDTSIPAWDYATTVPAFAESLIQAAFWGQNVFELARAKIPEWKRLDLAQTRSAADASASAAPPPRPRGNQTPDPRYTGQTATHTITTIQSGDNAGMWVSVHFSSPDRESDVLHIVGGYEPSPQHARLGLLPIYLERFDQRLSCYQGADKIQAGDRSLTVRLNIIGQNALRLPETLHFVAGDPTDSFKAARELLGRMKQFESGKIIELL
jgi:hypothetical protein